MYKVYFEDDSMMLTLSEVAELLQATPKEIRKIFLCRVCRIGDFQIINYNRR